MTGPLSGCKVVELAGLGPAPFAAMTLADLGAEVVRVERPGGSGFFPGLEHLDILNRGKKSVALDLKDSRAVAAVLDMVAQADILIEGYRPGVVERLGLGPDTCFERNPRLVYGRMTGWGQQGPLAHSAGHDIGYIALTGALHAIGSQGGPPQIPLNLVGDFGGGAIYLVMGVLAALRHSDRTGQGQVVDAAIVDGAAHLLGSAHMMLAANSWNDERGVNMLDGGWPFYAVYETSDGKYMAVGALEPQFYAELLRILGLGLDPKAQHDRSQWPEMRRLLAATFMQRTRDEWAAEFEGTDACVAPVLSLVEAAEHPHVAARGTIVEHDGVLQAAPAPRFSGTPTGFGTPPPVPGRDTAEVLRAWGVSGFDDLIDAGIMGETAVPR
ncbi:CaiB/BaiF CoA transferase family protein [Prescottella agglutinans]|uniref:Alpha-methylacyl-CoA racemase n=1 Tax=Prescottella agglutinans TaxID=1644129 RepID=A0ABT6ME99_9NOCA|nr:CaiB/BaiF CoA-transferase family protein [Prescottella agglutinans]MDH6282646.1 alpha-methylacyl-CoA racemase [Prescottella agglutinans]